MLIQMLAFTVAVKMATVFVTQMSFPVFLAMWCTYTTHALAHEYQQAHPPGVPLKVYQHAVEQAEGNQHGNNQHSKNSPVFGKSKCNSSI